MPDTDTGRVDGKPKPLLTATQLLLEQVAVAEILDDSDAGEQDAVLAVLGASSYTNAEATWSQSLPDRIGSHQRAFAFFGGAVELLVPDNLRAAVRTPDRYDPEPNATYLELARHYGTAILPAGPYKPKDEAKAEVAVQAVERWVLPRLRHQRFFSLSELNGAIAAPRRNSHQMPSCIGKWLRSTILPRSSTVPA